MIDMSMKIEVLIPSVTFGNVRIGTVVKMSNEDMTPEKMRKELLKQIGENIVAQREALEAYRKEFFEIKNL